MRSVGLHPGALDVRLSGLEGRFRLPIGPAQIFEAWAWLVEMQYRTLIAGEPVRQISRDPSELTYAWPVFALAARRGTPVESLPLHYVGIELLCYLLTSLFYDHRVMAAEGDGTPTSFHPLQQDLERRGATAGRVLWQLLRDDPLAKPRSATSLIDVMDDSLRGARLPELSWVACRDAAPSRDHAARVRGRPAERPSGSKRAASSARSALRMGEIDLLGTSTRNLHVLASKVDTALAAPTALLDDFEPAIVVSERSGCHEWSVVVRQDLPEAERRVLDVRSRLRQQIAIYEHILEQFVSGAHLGCYGSPEWHLPINACPHAAACLALDVRRGIEFCVDDDWRLKVTAVLSAVAEPAGEAIGEDLVPGLQDAAKLYDRWLAGLARGSDDGLLETGLRGLLAHEPPDV